jgi:hypothetical protein
MKPHLPDVTNFALSRELSACQSKSRRNGKVARLPAALRDQINQMLDDGVPYKTIIKRLGEPGQHLNDDNISNWRLGGYQDYLKAQALNDRAHVQTQAAADIVRDHGAPAADQTRDACNQIALLQYFNALWESGDDMTRQALKENPSKIFSLLNAICRLTNTNLAIQKQDSPSPPLAGPAWSEERAGEKTPPSDPGAQPKPGW